MAFSTVVILTIFALLFMASAAFFTGSEIALISCDRMQLKKLSKQGNKQAAFVLMLLSNIESLLTTTQFGTNFSIAATTSIATIIGINYSNGENDWRVLAVLTPFILIFCDSLPKVTARAYADKLALRVAYPILISSTLFSPIIAILTFYTRFISKVAGFHAKNPISVRQKARKELQSILSDDSEDNEIKQNQKRMISRILEFSQQIVRSAMVPLVKMDAIEDTVSIGEAIEMFENLRHSRIPVFTQRIDNIIGVLNVEDIIGCENDDEKIKKYIRDVVYAPESQQLDALITEMKIQKAKMAIVVDEYGGAVGMITKEDILEEVVGDLDDEFDEKSLTFRRISNNSFIANVNIEIDDLNERLKSNLPKGEYETLAGFLLQQFNRIPVIDDELYYSDLIFRIYRANSRSIQTVIITQTHKREEDAKS